MWRKFISLFLCAAATLLLSGCFLFVLPDEPAAEIANAAEFQPGELTYHLNDEDWFCAMQIFLPENRSAPVTAIIIFPGGAYGVLDYKTEGTDVAEYFAQNGIAGIVVKYPLGSIFGHFRHHPDMQNAAQRAVRLIRYHAGALNIHPQKIGVLGFSAGGHLAGLTALGRTAGDPSAADPVEKVSAMPDFIAMGYPVVSMTENAHEMSRKNLLGDESAPELLHALSLEKQIKPGFPPTFLWTTLEDDCVSPENSRLLATALKKHGIPHRTLLYEHGPHGMGLLNGKQKKLYPETAKWSGELLQFLQEQKLLQTTKRKEK